MDSDKLSPLITRIRRRSSHKLIGIGVIVAILFTAHTHLSNHQSTSNLLPTTTAAAAMGAVTAASTVGAHMEAESGPIPNIVHYVWLLNSDRSNSRLDFQHFLSLYAASIYWHPDKIYIHTDIPKGEFLPNAADKAPGHRWNRLIMDQPNVEINHIKAPTVVPGTKKAIEKVEHKSDFLRLGMMRKYGGVYLDWDAHPLRDIKPLRYSGFKAVVGREPKNRIQTGTYMAKKDSNLMKTWSEKMGLAFNGQWTHHSNTLLTYLAPRMVPESAEVLIMDQDAFTPGDFSNSAYNQLYDAHKDSPVQDLRDIWEGLFDRFDDPKKWPKWHIDYSATYVLHVFGLQRAQKDLELKGFTDLTAEYILARQSNAARALYPTVRKMIDQGLIPDPLSEG